MRILKSKFLLTLVLAIILNFPSSSVVADDLFQKLNSLQSKGCKLSNLLRINEITEKKIILGNREIDRENIVKIYGKLKVGNYGVIASCSAGLILIIFPGGPHGPAID